MPSPLKHVAIIPARNEGAFIERTLNSLLNQTLPPDRIYVVDDGSTDETSGIVTTLASTHNSLRLVTKKDRGCRYMGAGVVEVFNQGYELCRDESITYISKIDADLIFPKHYFETLFSFMDPQPRLAVASGIIYDLIEGKLMRLRTPKNHVPGALKTYRKEIFDKIGGFLPTLGWDIIDLVKVRALGLTTATIDGLVVTHLRQHGSAEGVLKGKYLWGVGAYTIGSHPFFVLCRGAYRMFEPPYITGGLAFWWGYIYAALRRLPRISDTELICALRKEQLTRLLRLIRAF